MMNFDEPCASQGLILTTVRTRKCALIALTDAALSRVDSDDSEDAELAALVLPDGSEEMSSPAKRPLRKDDDIWL